MASGRASVDTQSKGSYRPRKSQITEEEEEKKDLLEESMHVGVSCICSSPPCKGKGNGLVFVMFLVADQWEWDEQGKK